MTYHFYRIPKYIKSLWFRLLNGFYPEEWFSFYYHNAKWALPRLKYLRKNLHGYPSTLTCKEWEVILDKIIWAFEQILVEDAVGKIDNYEKVQEGLELFGKYYWNLWD